jgi:hypothetical protein
MAEHTNFNRGQFIENTDRGYEIKDPGEISDGYHTFNELYAHRHALTLLLFSTLDSIGMKVVKSKRSKEGELCFGGDWFVALAELPSGQVSYHLPISLWDGLEVDEVERSTWDGHTPDEVIARLFQCVPFRPFFSTSEATGNRSKG